MPANKHPWNLSIRDFLAQVESQYGLRRYRIIAQDPTGRIVSLWFLKSADGETSAHLPDLDLDEELDPYSTASLCRRLGIPPEDFGLLPEEDEKEDLFELDD